jgi:hypothetical protein
MKRALSTALLALFCIAADAPPTPESLRASTKALVASWAAAQRAGDAAGYLAFYDHKR